MHELSRKTFLKGGGAMVVGFSLAGAALAGKSSAAGFPKPSPDGYLPDLTAVDSWIRINSDNTVTLTSGQTEQGQGTQTALLMIVAEELDVSFAQMRYYGPQDTWVNATGGGSASQGITLRALPVRAAAVAARNALLDLAATQLGVPRASLSVKDGVVSGGGKTVTYGQLIGDKLLNVKMPAGQTSLAAGASPAKPVSTYKVVGTSPPRIDIPDKAAGSYVYVHNIKVPGMVHARVVRPHGAGAVGSQNHYPLSIDRNSIKHIPDAQVVQLNNFVAVVAPKEYDAIQAAAQLKVTWKSDPKLASSGNYYKDIRDKDAAGLVPARYTKDTGNVEAALKSAAKVVSGTYKYQYNAHVPIGPQCAVADVRPDGATIYCNSQALTGIAEKIGGLVGLQPKQVRVFYYEGSSSYGTGQIPDTYIAAAVVSKAIGKPVRMQWMRWDQHGWDEFGPASMIDLRGGVDANGKIVALDWVEFGQPNTTVKTTEELLGTATWPATPALSSTYREPWDGMYTVANKRVLEKYQPLYGGNFKVTPLRAPWGPQPLFAGEQMIDELAYAAKVDPVGFRRANIDPAAPASVTGLPGGNGEMVLSTLDAVAKASNWQPRVAASRLSSANVVTGRGVAVSGYEAAASAVADIEVNKRTGKIVVKHVYAAQNSGLSVYPGGVANQIEGCVIQGVSRALYEELRFTKERITSTDWVSYPILRFKDSPKVTPIVVQRTDLPAYGAGEPALAPIAAAIANAFFDATGVRIREAPMTPARVRSVLKAAGVS